MTLGSINSEVSFFRAILRKTPEFIEISSKFKELKDFMNKTADENFTDELKEIQSLYPNLLQPLSNVFVGILPMIGVSSKNILLRDMCERELLCENISSRAISFQDCDLLRLDEILVENQGIYDFMDTTVKSFRPIEKSLQGLFQKDQELFAAMWPWPGYMIHPVTKNRLSSIGDSGYYKFFLNEEDLMLNFPEAYKK